jgi:hypothetical protein
MNRVLLCLLAAFLIAGCQSDDPVSAPSEPLDPASWFVGSYDGSELVLQTVQVPVPDGRPVEVQLVATDLQYYDATAQLTASVAIRNQSNLDLWAPARVGVGDFRPESVQPVNATATSNSAGRWWYDYSGNFGDDGLLEPGELSDPLLWILQLPGPISFSFSAEARFSPEPSRPVIAGRVFNDLDLDGEADADEPAGIGDVRLVAPDGQATVLRPDSLGRWSQPVTVPGLYTATWLEPPILGPTPICLTTPNPLQILLVAGPDGLPESYLEAHFGVAPEPCVIPPPIPVVSTDEPLDSLESDWWTLVDMEVVSQFRWFHGRAERSLQDYRLEITVGYGGCQPDHPLTFVIGPPSEVPGPDRLPATLVHDDLDELCDAYFTPTRSVDLDLVRQIWAERTGYTGPLTLVLHTPLGIRELPLDY